MYERVEAGLSVAVLAPPGAAVVLPERLFAVPSALHQRHVFTAIGLLLHGPGLPGAADHLYSPSAVHSSRLGRGHISLGVPHTQVPDAAGHSAWKGLQGCGCWKGLSVLRAQKGEFAGIAWPRGLHCGLDSRPSPRPFALPFPPSSRVLQVRARRRAATCNDAPCLPHGALRPCDRLPADGAGAKARVWLPGGTGHAPRSRLSLAALRVCGSRPELPELPGRRCMKAADQAVEAACAPDAGSHHPPHTARDARQGKRLLGPAHGDAGILVTAASPVP